MMLEIDGSMGEGGGSVVRMAVALSAACGTPVKIFNVRTKRPKPGLRSQHLRAVEAVGLLSSAKVEGLKLNSTELIFEPRKPAAGRFKIEIGTAGSTMLVLQALMPAAAFAPGLVEVEIRGGTDNPLAPPVDYMKNVTLPVLQKMGLRVELECLRRGHYPHGGGIVRAKIHPVKKLTPLVLGKNPGVKRIEGVAHCVRLPTHIATRMAHSAKRALLKAGYTDVEIKTETYEPSEDPHLGPGGGIVLWAELESGGMMGASSLARKGVPAERIGERTASDLAQQLKTGASVDRYLTDQLIPYVALADGTSEFKSAELTLHALTNIALVEKIVGARFGVEGEFKEPGVIRAEGVSLSNPNYSEE